MISNQEMRNKLMNRLIYSRIYECSDVCGLLKDGEEPPEKYKTFFETTMSILKDYTGIDPHSFEVTFEVVDDECNDVQTTDTVYNSLHNFIFQSNTAMENQYGGFLCDISPIIDQCIPTARGDDFEKCLEKYPEKYENEILEYLSMALEVHKLIGYPSGFLPYPLDMYLHIPDDVVEGCKNYDLWKKVLDIIYAYDKETIK